MRWDEDGGKSQGGTGTAKPRAGWGDHHGAGGAGMIPSKHPRELQSQGIHSSVRDGDLPPKSCSATGVAPVRNPEVIPDKNPAVELRLQQGWPRSFSSIHTNSGIQPGRDKYPGKVGEELRAAFIYSLWTALITQLCPRPKLRTPAVKPFHNSGIFPVPRAAPNPL